MLHGVVERRQPLDDLRERFVIRREIRHPAKAGHDGVVLRQEPFTQELRDGLDEAKPRLPQPHPAELDVEDSSSLDPEGEWRCGRSRRNGPRCAGRQHVAFEVGDLLLDAVLGDDEIVPREIVDGIALAIDDAHVERHEGDAGAEGRVLRLG